MKIGIWDDNVGLAAKEAGCAVPFGKHQCSDSATSPFGHVPNSVDLRGFDWDAPRFALGVRMSIARHMVCHGVRLPLCTRQVVGGSLLASVKVSEGGLVQVWVMVNVGSRHPLT